jgi:hypothetical protein
VLRGRGFSMCASLTGASLAQTKLKNGLATKGGVVMARKGGVSPDRVIKTLDLPDFQNYLAARRTRLFAKALKSAGVPPGEHGRHLIS